MSIANPDLKVNLKESLEGAENPEQMASVFMNWADSIQQDIIKEAHASVSKDADSAILAQRGIRQLTSEEKTYYGNVIEAMKSGNFKQALTDADVVLPKTVITAVFEDLTRDHEILEFVDFQNVAGAIEYIYNKDGVELATWSPLCDDIVKEISSSFAKMDMNLFKLSAFLPVCKAMLDLGPEWLDRYVRTVLSEAIAEGLEQAIIDGDGNNKPIGMTRQVQDDVVVSGGVYPQKEAIPVTKLDPANYGQILAEMAKSPVENGRSRVITEVAFIVNPVDYWNIVFPVSTLQRVDGSWNRDMFPFPTRIIQSPYVPEGKAIMAMRGKYFFGLGTGTTRNGNLSFSDEYRFLEDERVYLTKLYGNGRPKDNNAFQLLDISALEATHPIIETVTAATAGA